MTKLQQASLDYIDDEDKLKLADALKENREVVIKELNIALRQLELFNLLCEIAQKRTEIIKIWAS